jgi:hypothetical protein
MAEQFESILNIKGNPSDLIKAVNLTKQNISEMVDAANRGTQSVALSGRRSMDELTQRVSLAKEQLLSLQKELQTRVGTVGSLTGQRDTLRSELNAYTKDYIAAQRQMQQASQERADVERRLAEATAKYTASSGAANRSAMLKVSKELSVADRAEYEAKQNLITQQSLYDQGITREQRALTELTRTQQTSDAKTTQGKREIALALQTYNKEVSESRQIEGELRQIEAQLAQEDVELASKNKQVALSVKELSQAEAALAKETIATEREQARLANSAGTTASKERAAATSTKEAWAGIGASVGTHIGGIAVRLQGAQIGLLGLGTTLSTIGAKGKDFLSGAISSTADFEKQVLTVQAVMGNQFKGSLEDIRTLALGLGRDTVFTSTEAANAIETLVKAGVDWDNVSQGAARSVLDLAAATGEDIPGAVEVATTAMNVFGFKGSEMATVVDTVTKAVNASKISAHDFSESLKSMGPIAAELHIPFDTVAKSVAMLGNLGIKGSSAGTALRYFWLNMTPRTTTGLKAMEEAGLLTFRTETATTRLKEAGMKLAPTLENVWSLYAKGKGLSIDLKAATDGQISSFEKWAVKQGIINSKFMDTNGELTDMSGALKTLYDAVKKYDPGARLAILSDIFKERGGAKAAAPFVEMFSQIEQAAEDSGKSVDDIFAGITTDMDRAGGAAEIQTKIMSGLAGRIEYFRGSWDALVKTIGAVFQDKLAHAVDRLSTLVNTVAELTNKNPQLAQTVGYVIAFGAALATVAGPLTLFMAAWPYLSMAISGVGVAIVPIIGLLVLLTAAGLGFFELFTTYAPSFKRTLDELLGPIQKLKSQFEDFGRTFFQNVIQPLADKFAVFIRDELLPDLVKLGQWFADRLPQIGSLADAAFNKVLVPVLKDVWKILKENVVPILGALFDAILKVGPGFLSGVSQAWKGLYDALEPIAKLATDAIVSFFKWIGDNGKDVGLVLGTLAVAIWGVNVAVGALDALMALNPIVLAILAIVAAIALLKLAWDNDFLGMRTAIVDLVTKLTNDFNELGGALGNVGDALKNVGQWFGRTWTDASNFFGNLAHEVELMATKWQDFVGAMVDVTQGNYAEALAKLILITHDVGGQLATETREAGEKAALGLVDGWQAKASGVYNSVQGIVLFTHKILDEAKAKYEASGQGMAQAFADGIKAKEDALHSALNDAQKILDQANANMVAVQKQAGTMSASAYATAYWDADQKLREAQSHYEQVSEDFGTQMEELHRQAGEHAGTKYAIGFEFKKPTILNAVYNAVTAVAMLLSGGANSAYSAGYNVMNSWGNGMVAAGNAAIKAVFETYNVMAAALGLPQKSPTYISGVGGAIGNGNITVVEPPLDLSIPGEKPPPGYVGQFVPQSVVSQNIADAANAKTQQQGSGGGGGGGGGGTPTYNSPNGTPAGGSGSGSTKTAAQTAADAVKSVADAIKAGVTAFKDISSLTVPDNLQAKAKEFADAASVLITQVQRVALNFTDKNLATIAAFGDAAGKVTDFLSKFVDFSAKINDPKFTLGPVVEKVTHLVAQAHVMMNLVGDAIANHGKDSPGWSPEGIQMVADFADAGGKVTDFLSKFVDFNGKLNTPGFTIGPVVEKLGHLVAQAAIMMDLVGGALKGKDGWSPENITKVGAFADAGGKVTDFLLKYVSFMQALNTPGFTIGPMVEKMGHLVAQAAILMDMVGHALEGKDGWSPENITKVGAFSDAGGKVADFLGKYVVFMQALQAPTFSLTDVVETVRNLVNQAALMMDLLGGALQGKDGWSDGSNGTENNIARIGAFADSGGKVADFLGKYVTLMLAIVAPSFKLKDVTQAVQNLVNQAVLIMDMLGHAITGKDGWSNDNVARVGTFADNGGKVVDMVAKTVTLMTALGGKLKLGDIEDAKKLALQAVALFTAFQQALADASVSLDYNGQASQKAVADASDNMGKVVTLVSTTLDALTKLGGGKDIFKGNPSQYIGQTIQGVISIVKALSEALSSGGLADVLNSMDMDAVGKLGPAISSITGAFDVFTKLSTFSGVSQTRLILFRDNLVRLLKELPTIADAIKGEALDAANEFGTKVGPALAVLASALDIFKGITGTKDKDGNVTGGLLNVDPAAIGRAYGQVENAPRQAQVRHSGLRVRPANTGHSYRVLGQSGPRPRRAEVCPRHIQGHYGRRERQGQAAAGGPGRYWRTGGQPLHATPPLEEPHNRRGVSGRLRRTLCCFHRHCSLGYRGNTGRSKPGNVHRPGRWGRQAGRHNDLPGLGHERGHLH